MKNERKMKKKKRTKIQTTSLTRRGDIEACYRRHDFAARVAIRLTHGPAPKLPPGAYKPTSDEELRRRAKVMGDSASAHSGADE